MWANLWAPTLYSDTAAVMLQALRAEGVPRLLAITSSGVEHDPGMSWWYRWIVRPILRNVYRDMARMERAIEAEPNLRWTLVRPSYLTDGASAECRVRDRRCPAGGWWLTRNAVGRFMAREAVASEWVHRHPALAV